MVVLLLRGTHVESDPAEVSWNEQRTKYFIISFMVVNSQDQEG